MSLKTIIDLFNLAVQHHLLPESCKEFEFTIAEISDKQIICFGIEYWPDNYRELYGVRIPPKLQGIPPSLQPQFNHLAKCCITDNVSLPK